MTATRKIKVGYNAGGDALVTSMVESNRVGRSLARVEEFEAEGPVSTLFKNSVGQSEIKGFAIRRKSDGQRRTIYGYKVTLNEGNPFLLTMQDDNTLGWGHQTVPAAYATGETVHMYTVLVETVDGDGNLRAPQQSYIHQMSRYDKIAKYQVDDAIDPNSIYWANPLTIRPTDVFVAYMLANRSIAVRIPERKLIHNRLQAYAEDERVRSA